MTLSDRSLATREFSAAEIAAVARIKPALIRDWRRRGIIGEPTGTGQKMYSIYDGALIFLLAKLSAHGLSVKWTPARNLAAEMLAHFVALQREAWATNEDWTTYREGIPTLLRMTIDGGSDHIKAAEDNGADQWYLDELRALETRPPEGWRYLVIEDDWHDVAVNLDDALANTTGSGVVSIVDMARLGAMFVANVSGPIACFQMVADDE